jgi:hypothetical protein
MPSRTARPQAFSPEPELWPGGSSRGRPERGGGTRAASRHTNRHPGTAGHDRYGDTIRCRPTQISPFCTAQMMVAQSVTAMPNSGSRSIEAVTAGHRCFRLPWGWPWPLCAWPASYREVLPRRLAAVVAGAAGRARRRWPRARSGQAATAYQARRDGGDGGLRQRHSGTLQAGRRSPGHIRGVRRQEQAGRGGAGQQPRAP